MSVNKGFKNILTGLSLAPLLIFSMQANSQNGEFRDDFIGEQKRPEWKILDEDKNRYAFVDNEFLLLLTKKPNVNYFEYQEEILADDYSIIVSVQDVPSEPYQGFALSISQDDDNTLQLYMYANASGYKYVVFNKKLNGENSEYETDRIDRNSKFNSFSLSISKKGVEYTGIYSTDQSGWKDVGKHVLLNFTGKPGFTAYNYKDAPESPVKVDYFEITPQ